jgi:hypothetical protein
MARRGWSISSGPAGLTATFTWSAGRKPSGRSSSWGALDRLEILVLPILLGAGVPLSPRPAPPLPLRLLSPGQVFPDGTAGLVYAVA